MSETTPKVKSGNNLIKIVIIALLVAILAGGFAFAGYFVASKQKTSTAKAEVVTEAQVDEAFFEAGEFLVNLADTDEKRFLKVKIVVAYNSKTKKLTEELTTKKDVVSDCIIGVIRDKKVEEISGKGAENLKKDLIEKINSKLAEGKLTSIYYSDFLIQ